MELIDPSLIEKGGLIGLLALGVLAFMREWVVPGITHRAALSDKDQQITLLKQQVAARDAQVERLAEVGHTVDAVLRSVDELAGRKQP